MDDGDRAHIAIGKCSVMRRRDGSICTFWIWCCLNDMNKLHVQDIVDVDLNLQDNDKHLLVKLDSKDGNEE